jgi:hypothetical protein
MIKSDDEIQDDNEGEKRPFRERSCSVGDCNCEEEDPGYDIAKLSKEDL